MLPESQHKNIVMPLPLALAHRIHCSLWETYTIFYLISGLWVVISAQLTAFVNGLIQQGAAGQIFNPQTQSPFPLSSPPAINSAQCVHSTCTLSPWSFHHVHMGSPYHGAEANNNTDVSCPSEDKVYFLDSGGHTEKVWLHCYEKKKKVCQVHVPKISWV